MRHGDGNTGVVDEATARQYAQERRMHYEVAPEVHFGGDGAKRRVGFCFRVSGAHARGDKPQPGCVLCTGIYRDLKKVARFAIDEAGAGLRWEFDPFSPSLYWVPSEHSDEVSLTVVGMAPDYARGVDAEADAVGRAVRRQLEAVGVFEGRWKLRVVPDGTPGRSAVVTD